MPFSAQGAAMAIEDGFELAAFLAGMEAPQAFEAFVAHRKPRLAALRAAGMRVTVEESATRAIGIEGYRAAGCDIAAEGSWPEAPQEAIIFGLKELPEDGTTEEPAE